MRLSFVFVRPEWSRPDIIREVSTGMGLGLQVMHIKRTPVKFTDQGRRSYRFKPRTKKYVADKKRIKGHNNPNVWSGVSRTAILRPMTIRPLKTRPEATGRIKARIFNLSNALGTHEEIRHGVKFRVRNFKRQPDQKAEFEKLLKTDEKIVADATKRHVGQWFDTKGRKKTTRI